MNGEGELVSWQVWPAELAREWLGLDFPDPQPGADRGVQALLQDAAPLLRGDTRLPSGEIASKSLPARLSGELTPAGACHDHSHGETWVGTSCHGRTADGCCDNDAERLRQRF